jgi:hypothetical protein
LAVVRGDVKNALRRILNAGDVDGDQIFGDLLPFHLSGTTCRNMKHFRPQPKDANDILTEKPKQETKKNCSKITKKERKKKVFFLCFDSL